MRFLKRLVSRVAARARALALWVGKRIPLLLRWARAAVYAKRRRDYRRLCAQLPVDPSLAVFEAYAGRRYACSPRALYQCLIDPACSTAPPMRTVWAFRVPIAHALAQRGFDVRGLDDFPVPATVLDLDAVVGPDALDELRHTTIVAYQSREYYRTYAQARLWVANGRIPMQLTTRAGQTFVQTWHGTPLKRLGCDLKPTGWGNAIYLADEMQENYRFEGQRMSYLLSPSRFATEKFISAFDLASLGRDGDVIEEGYPRNDFLSKFTAEDVERIKRRLGIPSDRRVILYAPTWRDDQHSATLGYTYDVAADFAALRAELGSDHVVLFRAHYFVANAFDFAAYDGFVIDVTAIDDVNDLYVVSDMLVTDYSSVFFDYANLRRPMAFYMYDLEHYESQLHGFYLDLDELPGPIVRTTQELVAAIRDAGRPDARVDPRYDAFCACFTYLDDGHASERVLARVLPKRSSDGDAS